MPALRPNDVFRLLWLDPACVGRLRARPAWRKLLDALQADREERDDRAEASALDVLLVEGRRLRAVVALLAVRLQGVEQLPPGGPCTQAADARWVQPEKAKDVVGAQRGHAG